jgi:Zn-dependent M28 family amino/carboxypeptidase
MHQPNTLTGLLLLSTLIIFSCSSTLLSETEALQLIDRNEILRDVLVLSADDMEGRSSATSGAVKAADFISDRFKANGLSPINGSYFQPFQMLGSKKISKKSSLVIKKQNTELKYKSDVDLSYYSTSQKEVVDIKDASLVFVGYGVEAPEYDWDDIKGVDLEGKVLLFLRNDPPVTENGVDLFKGEAMTSYGRRSYKFEQAARLGAAGAILIHTTASAGYPFRETQSTGSREKFKLDLPEEHSGLDFVAVIDSTNSNIIAQSMGTDLDGLFELSASRDFKPIDTGYRVTTHIETVIRTVETKNVMGILPGSDPILKSQAIVFSAHYDHLGKNDDLVGDDKIYNGAWDNALGTVCIINLAKAFSALQDRPRRSIIFLACAAEERGSLGSKWFVENSPIEKNHLVANFNIDMPQIFGLTTDISVIGLDMSTLGETIREIALQYNVTKESGEIVDLDVVGDLYPNEGYFYRSDQINFAKAGIPVLFLWSGIQFADKLTVELEEYWKTHYHQVIDEVNEAWDLSGCERDMRVQFQTALKVANADDIPHWVEGSEFEIEWMKLHGISD